MKKRTASAPANDNDWIFALAKQSATLESPAPSKAERIERRNAKKRRRKERKPGASLKSANTTSTNENENDELRTSGKRMNRMSTVCLNNLEATLEHRISTLQHASTRSRPYQRQAGKKGKATAGNQLTDGAIQPRRRDYGGLGLARPSIFISLRDPSFVPKLEEEFAEHVPGFFGKQKTKAMKKQLDGNMLWRQLAEKRNDNRKLDGKKLSEMGADERVEAMIKAGLI